VLQGVFTYRRFTYRTQHLAAAQAPERPARVARRKSKVDLFREQIADWLKQRLSGVRMLEVAREDGKHPYRGGSSVWRAAACREPLNGLHEQAVVDVPIRFEGLPGECLQVNWVRFGSFRSPSSNP
jgi:hypothetical protein